MLRKLRNRYRQWRLRRLRSAFSASTRKDYHLYLSQLLVLLDPTEFRDYPSNVGAGQRLQCAWATLDAYSRELRYYATTMATGEPLSAVPHHYTVAERSLNTFLCVTEQNHYTSMEHATALFKTTVESYLPYLLNQPDLGAPGTWRRMLRGHSKQAAEIVQLLVQQYR